MYYISHIHIFLHGRDTSCIHNIPLHSRESLLYPYQVYVFMCIHNTSVHGRDISLHGREIYVLHTQYISMWQSYYVCRIYLYHVCVFMCKHNLYMVDLYMVEIQNAYIIYLYIVECIHNTPQINIHVLYITYTYISTRQRYRMHKKHIHTSTQQRVTDVSLPGICIHVHT